MTADLDCIEEQQRRLRFERLRRGHRLAARDATSDGGRWTSMPPCTIEVRLGGDTVFLHAMRGTSPANADWARRKRNVVEMLHRPSYAVGLEAQRDGRSVLDEMGLPDRDVASHGGSFPIVVDGVGCVGVVDRVRTPATPGPRTRRRRARRPLRCRSHGGTPRMSAATDTAAMGCAQHRQDRSDGGDPGDPAERTRRGRRDRIA